MRYLFAITLTVILLASHAEGKPVKELAEFTRTSVATMNEAVGEAVAYPDRTGWAFKRFLLRLTAKVGFDIEAVKLELLPELELVWQKEHSS